MDATSNLVSTGADLAYLNGYGRYSFGQGAFASPGSNAVRLDRNAQETENQADCTRMVFQQGLDTVVSQFESAERARQFTGVTDGQFRMELRSSDQVRELCKNINDNARESDRQYSDLKAAVAKLESGQDLLSVKVDHNTALAQKNAEIIALEAKLDIREQTINNFCCPKPARCVDPCCGGSSSTSSSDVAAAVVNALAPALNSIATAIAGLSPGNS